jgi:hypothetical protein
MKPVLKSNSIFESAMNGHARKATNQEKHPTVTMMRYV